MATVTSHTRDLRTWLVRTRAQARVAPAGKIRVVHVANSDVGLKIHLGNYMRYQRDQGYDVSAITHPGRWLTQDTTILDGRRTGHRPGRGHAAGGQEGLCAAAQTLGRGALVRLDGALPSSRPRL